MKFNIILSELDQHFVSVHDSIAMYKVDIIYKDLFY